MKSSFDPNANDLKQKFVAYYQGVSCYVTKGYPGEKITKVSVQIEKTVTFW